MNCPDCGRDMTNKKNCGRCGNQWYSILDRPKQCPRCKSPYWDRERRPTYNFDKLVPVGQSVYLPHADVGGWGNWPAVQKRWDALEKWLKRNTTEYTLEVEIRGTEQGLRVWRKD